MDSQIKLLIENIIASYESLIELSQKERTCLITMDTDSILPIIQEKEKHLHIINECLKKLEKLDTLKLKILQYKNKIIELSSKFLYENSINEKIAKQHLAFSQSMLNLYAGFLQLHQTYDNKATIGYNINFSRTV